MDADDLELQHQNISSHNTNQQIIMFLEVFSGSKSYIHG